MYQGKRQDDGEGSVLGAPERMAMPFVHPLPDKPGTKRSLANRVPFSPTIATAPSCGEGDQVQQQQQQQQQQ